MKFSNTQNRKILYISCLPESGTAQSLLLKKQMNDLKEENESLKSAVHRVSVELSSYQAKYRPINPEQTVSIYFCPLL